jgi:hypothetical protein
MSRRVACLRRGCYLGGAIPVSITDQHDTDEDRGLSSGSGARFEARVVNRVTCVVYGGESKGERRQPSSSIDPAPPQGKDGTPRLSLTHLWAR